MSDAPDDPPRADGARRRFTRRKKVMTTIGLILAGVVLLAVAARLAIPWLCDVARRPQLLAERDGAVRLLDAACDAPLDGSGDARPLPNPFTVVSWNIYKGARVGWDGDLARFAKVRDLALLQESGHPPVLPWFLTNGWTAVMSRTFAFRGQEAGALTAARGGIPSACVLLAGEPWLGIPKSAVVTRHPLGDETLLAVNVHSVNFTLGVGDYRGQLAAIAAVVRDHDGPVILAGDFNSWSGPRAAALEETVTALGLGAVPLDPDGRTRMFGRPLDHVFYRGLELVTSAAPPTEGSDHAPLLATFALPGAPQRHADGG